MITDIIQNLENVNEKKQTFKTTTTLLQQKTEPILQLGNTNIVKKFKNSITKMFKQFYNCPIVVTGSTFITTSIGVYAISFLLFNLNFLHTSLHVSVIIATKIIMTFGIAIFAIGFTKYLFNKNQYK